VTQRLFRLRARNLQSACRNDEPLERAIKRIQMPGNRRVIRHIKPVRAA